MKFVRFFIIPIFFFIQLFSQISAEIELKIIAKIKEERFKDLKQEVDLNSIKSHPLLINPHQKFGLKECHPIKCKTRSNMYVLDLKSTKFFDEIIKEYMSTGLFDYIEVDERIPSLGVKGIKTELPNDPKFNYQWAFQNDGSFSDTYFQLKNKSIQCTEDADINLPEAWEIEEGDSSIIVGIVDSGIKLNHKEFEGRLWSNAKEIPNNNTDDDNNGFMDDTMGWDFENKDNTIADDYGHGTEVASIIGVNSNNNFLYAGINKQCKLMIVKASRYDGTTTHSQLAESIIYAVDNGAKLINASFGTPSFSQTVQDAVNYAYENGVVFVAPTGNNNKNVKNYPGCYDRAITVGATDPDDGRSIAFNGSYSGGNNGSNYGDSVDIVAPGNYLALISHTNDEVFTGGTSFAAPMVTGVASLLLSKNPSLTPSEVYQILIATAKDQVGRSNEDTPGFDIYHGWGRLDAFAALSATPLGVIKQQKQKQPTVFPNPSAGILNLVNNNYHKIAVYDITSKLMYDYVVGDQPSETIKIDLSTLPNGMYFLQTENKLKGIHWGKIILNRE